MIRALSPKRICPGWAPCDREREIGHVTRSSSGTERKREIQSQLALHYERENITRSSVMTDFSRTILLGHLFPKKKKMGQFFLEQIFLEHLFHGTKIYSGKNKNLSWEKVGFRDKKLSQKNKSRKKLFPKNCPLEKSCLGKSVPEKNERERERQQWSECTAHRTHTVSAHSDTIFFCKILINGAWYDSKIGYRWAGGGEITNF